METEIASVPQNGGCSLDSLITMYSVDRASCSDMCFSFDGSVFCHTLGNNTITEDAEATV